MKRKTSKFINQKGDKIKPKMVTINSEMNIDCLIGGFGVVRRMDLFVLRRWKSNSLIEFLGVTKITHK